MGIPVNNINSFEGKLKKRARTKWVLIIFANAESDSRAVDYVIRNFNVLDTFSDAVDFFMPGYDVSNQTDLKLLEICTPHNYPDYARFNRNCVKVIKCSRLGNIVFNQAEFVDFAMELMRKNNNYVYTGVCQMVLIPVINFIPDYMGAAVFDLDNIINTHSNISLEAFFARVFQIIRNAGSPLNLEIQLEGINWVLADIENLYNEATTANENADLLQEYETIETLERHLGWDLDSEYCFISYSSRNVLQAEMLKNNIENAGLHVWMAPDGIPQGADYLLMVPIALKRASHFVLLLTPDSARSDWVSRELEIAINNGGRPKIKVVLGDGYTIEDMRQNARLSLLINRVQIRYEHNEITTSPELLNQFLND